MILAYLRLIAHCWRRWHRPECLRILHRGRVEGVRMSCSCGRTYYESGVFCA